MLSPERIKERKSGIGGTDQEPIWGISPFKSQYELYLEKHGDVEPEDISHIERVHFGSILEEVIAEEYMRRNEVKVQRRNNLLRHKEHDFLIANVDRVLVGQKKGLEIKTADKYFAGSWGESGTDEVPDYYRLQCEHYMIVTEMPEWDLAVLIGGNEYRQYTLHQDQELSEMMIEKAAKFWEHVQQGIPPEFDFAHSGALDLLKKMHPGTDGSTITLPEDIAHWHKVKQDAEKEVKQYQGVVDTCKARILAAMGDAAVGIVPGCSYQYKRSQVKANEYTVHRDAYMQMRGSQYKEKKS